MPQRDRDTGSTFRVSTASDGGQANGHAGPAAISGDGRYIVYESSASNLVPGDTNNSADVFVWDRNTGSITRISIADDGTEPNAGSYDPAISADGRYITYDSWATNLGSGGADEGRNVFVWDRNTGSTARVSAAGSPRGWPSQPEISSDGRYITYTSDATTLVPDDTNAVSDVFLWDRTNSTTTRVSKASDGTQGVQASTWPVISGDGRHVAYRSEAHNLVPDDNNGTYDVLSWDRDTGSTTLISTDSDGTQAANGLSGRPAVSSDGRFIAYGSAASNLIPDDTNGVEDVFLWTRP